MNKKLIIMIDYYDYYYHYHTCIIRIMSIIAILAIIAVVILIFVLVFVGAICRSFLRRESVQSRSREPGTRLLHPVLELL